MRFRLLFISLALIIFLALAASSFLRYQRENRTSVILLTIESLRYDLVTNHATPHLLEAAESGYTFSKHRSVSGWTGTNMITLLSGLSPFQSGVHTRGQSVASEQKLPLELLAQKGYRVAGVQGFMTMDLYRNLGLGVDDVGTDPILWLTQRALEKEPFFLWEHYLHTHLPYRAGKKYGVDIEKLATDQDMLQRLEIVRNRTHIKAGSVAFAPEDRAGIRALHEATVKEFDSWFARFWEFYTKSGLRKRCILIITADHGDEHAERGSVGHASTTLGGHLHEEIVRVPFFLWLPEKYSPKDLKNTEQMSDHRDVMVTLCALLDIGVPQWLEGQNLLYPKRATPWFGMTSGGGFSEQDPKNIAYFEYGAIAGEWKLLWRKYRNGMEEKRLYNLQDDAAEEHDCYAAAHEQVAGLERQLQEKIEAARLMPVRDDVKLSLVGGGPKWIFPERSGTYSHAQLDKRFYLEWQGERDGAYILQYQAGKGDNLLDGTLEVRGTKKDFGTVSKRFWETWVVPASPLRVRVRNVDHGGWSPWLELEALP